MTTPESSEDKALVEIQAALAKTSVSTKRKVVEKFVLAALGSIPWVGGFISAAASITVDQRNSEKDSFVQYISLMLCNFPVRLLVCC